MSDTSTDANKQLLHEWIDVVSSGQLDRIPEIWSSDVVLHAGTPGYGMGEAHGLEEMGKLFLPFVMAFPDASVRIERMVAEGDMVCNVYHVEATHEGDYFGVAATGKKIEMTFMGMYRIADGKIAEAWAIDDGLSILDQLGALPIKG